MSDVVHSDPSRSKPLAVEKHTQRTLRLLSRAYTSIALADAAAFLGLPQQEALQSVPPTFAVPQPVLTV